MIYVVILEKISDGTVYVFYETFVNSLFGLLEGLWFRAAAAVSKQRFSAFLINNNKELLSL